MKISIPDNNDPNSSQSSKSVLRDVIRVAGIGNCQYLLYIVPGTENCETFLKVLTTLVAHGLDPMLLEGNEVKILEKKNPKTSNDDKGLDRISKNILKNLHLVFAMDLEKPEVQELVQKFPFLMSKFVINHITQYNQSDFEEIAEIYLEENLENLDYDKKEDLPGVLSNVYLRAKDMILENTGVDVLKTSSFCNFLKEFHFLAKKHLGVRKDLLDSYNKYLKITN